MRRTLGIRALASLLPSALFYCGREMSELSVGTATSRRSLSRLRTQIDPVRLIPPRPPFKFACINTLLLYFLHAPVKNNHFKCAGISEWCKIYSEIMTQKCQIWRVSKHKASFTQEKRYSCDIDSDRGLFSATFWRWKGKTEPPFFSKGGSHCGQEGDLSRWHLCRCAW